MIAPRPVAVLVVAAFPPELAALRRALRLAQRRDRLRGAIACAAVGVGAVDAAEGTARALASARPRLLLLLGSAGSYGARPAVGTIAIAAGDVVLASTAAVRGDGYLPAPMLTRAPTSPALSRVLLAAAAGRQGSPTGAGSRAGAAAVMTGAVATPLAITSSSALASRLARATGASLENLEAFAVARAAAAARVPFAAVLGVSNRVGPDAHAQWRAHGAGVVAAAASVVLAALPALVERAGAAPPAPVRAPSRSGRRP